MERLAPAARSSFEVKGEQKKKSKPKGKRPDEAETGNLVLYLVCAFAETVGS